MAALGLCSARLNGKREAVMRSSTCAEKCTPPPSLCAPMEIAHATIRPHTYVPAACTYVEETAVLLLVGRALCRLSYTHLDSLLLRQIDMYPSGSLCAACPATLCSIEQRAVEGMHIPHQSGTAHTCWPAASQQKNKACPSAIFPNVCLAWNACS